MRWSRGCVTEPRFWSRDVLQLFRHLRRFGILVAPRRPWFRTPATHDFATFPTPKASLAGEMSLEREYVIDNRLQICKTAGQEVGAGVIHFSEAAYSRSNDIWGYWGPAG